MSQPPCALNDFALNSLAIILLISIEDFIFQLIVYSFYLQKSELTDPSLRNETCSILSEKSFVINFNTVFKSEERRLWFDKSNIRTHSSDAC